MHTEEVIRSATSHRSWHGSAVVSVTGLSRGLVREAVRGPPKTISVISAAVKCSRSELRTLITFLGLLLFHYQTTAVSIFVNLFDYTTKKLLA